MAGGIRARRGSAPGGQPSDMIYPSIRKLPLLGVRWAELYQQAKIQETVYQLLTQEYEIAKIQEAKEIPTAKVMDEATLPERKSFPPRIIFIILGASTRRHRGRALALQFCFLGSNRNRRSRQGVRAGSNVGAESMVAKNAKPVPSTGCSFSPIFFQLARIRL